MRIQRTWLNEDGFLATRMKCAYIETISSFFGKWYVLALMIYSFIMTSGEVHIGNTFWKMYSFAQIVCVHDNFILKFEVYYDLM